MSNLARGGARTIACLRRARAVSRGYNRPMRLLGLACAGMIGAAVVVPSADEQQFRAAIDLVRMPVIVSGRDGVVVKGLSQADFSVFEDGQPQEIAYFAAGAPGEALPLYLGLLLDSSLSMEQDLRTAANAAVKFVDSLEEAVDVTFIDFDTDIRLGRFSPQSYPHLFERIRRGRAKGYTRLYDALGGYLQSAFSRPGQHIVLLHTDGGDSASRTNLSQLNDLLRAGDAIVYIVGYLDNQSATVRVSQQMRMSQIARETGGEAHFPSTPRDIERAYEKILAEIAGRYTLGFISPNKEQGGKFRKVDVRLARDDLRGAKVRTRTGYRR
jgi:Ca-activated chloride channel family protein